VRKIKSNIGKITDEMIIMSEKSMPLFKSFMKFLIFTEKKINELISGGFSEVFTKAKENYEDKESLEKFIKTIEGLSQEEKRKYLEEYKMVTIRKFMKKIKEVYNIDMKKAYEFKDGKFCWKKEIEEKLIIFDKFEKENS